MWLHRLEILQWLPTAQSSEILTADFGTPEITCIFGTYVHFPKESFRVSKDSVISPQVTGSSSNP